MSLTAWDWLPANTLEHPSIRRRLDETIHDWCSTWFVENPLRVRSVSLGSQHAKSHRRVTRDGFSLICDGNKTNRLVGRALDVDLDRLEILDSDRRVIDAMEAAMFNDLANRLSNALPVEGIPAPAGTIQWVSISIGHESEGSVMIMEVDRQALHRLRLDAMAKAPVRRRALEPIASALAPTTVTVRAGIGAVTLPLSDARRLGIGDVLVLDRALDQPIVLHEAVSGTAFAQAEIISMEHPVTLRLQTHVAGQA